MRIQSKLYRSDPSCQATFDTSITHYNGCGEWPLLWEYFEPISCTYEILDIHKLDPDDGNAAYGFHPNFSLSLSFGLITAVLGYFL